MEELPNNVVPFYKFPKSSDGSLLSTDQMNAIIKMVREFTQQTLNNDLLYEAIRHVNDAVARNIEAVWCQVIDFPAENRGNVDYWEGLPEPEFDYVLQLTGHDGHRVHVEFYGANREVLKNVVSLGRHRETQNQAFELHLSTTTLNCFTQSMHVLVLSILAILYKNFPGKLTCTEHFEYELLQSPGSKVCIRSLPPRS